MAGDLGAQHHATQSSCRAPSRLPLRPLHFPEMPAMLLALARPQYQTFVTRKLASPRGLRTLLLTSRLSPACSCCAPLPHLLMHVHIPSLNFARQCS